MSAMDQMLASMLGKMIPAEVLELLSPENIQELKEMAGSFVAKISEDLDSIKHQNEFIIGKINSFEENMAHRLSSNHDATMNGIENVDKLSQSDSNGSGNRSRGGSNRAKPRGSGSD